MTNEEYEELQRLRRELEQLAEPYPPEFNALSPERPVYDALRLLARAMVLMERARAH